MSKLLVVPKGWIKGEPLEQISLGGHRKYALHRETRRIPLANQGQLPCDEIAYYWFATYHDRELFLDWWHDRLRKVKFAADCPPCDYCGEPVCTDCDEHYSECQCVGPAQLDDYETKEIDGELYYYVRPTV